MPTRRPLVAAFDFDGVVADYSGWKGIGVLGQVNEEVVTVMRTLQDEGWKVIVYTTRGVAEIRKYMEHHKIPYDEINRNSDIDCLGNKPIADVYIDDRAVCYNGEDAINLMTNIKVLVERKGGA